MSFEELARGTPGYTASSLEEERIRAANQRLEQAHKRAEAEELERIAQEAEVHTEIYILDPTIRYNPSTRLFYDTKRGTPTVHNCLQTVRGHRRAMVRHALRVQTRRLKSIGKWAIRHRKEILIVSGIVLIGAYLALGAPIPEWLEFIKELVV